jgi:hypothetical protein
VRSRWRSQGRGGGREVEVEDGRSRWKTEAEGGRRKLKVEDGS